MAELVADYVVRRSGSFRLGTGARLAHRSARTYERALASCCTVLATSLARNG